MYIILPVGVEHRAHRYPMVTFTLMGISTVIFLVDLGSIPGDAFFWCDGMPDWQPISALLERKT